MERERNYGLDLLRMVSMLMVAVLHVLGQGGVMARTGSNMATYYTCYFLEAACLCAVNCYGMLSGYVGVRSSFRTKKLIGMILTVEFYSVVIGLVLGLSNRAWLDRDTLLQILLPIQWKTWWYYSAYIGLYFLMPFLNRGVAALSGHEKRNLMSVFFMIFCIFPLVAKTFSSDFFALVGGYSLIWLIILYVFGACLRLLDEENALQSVQEQPSGQPLQSVQEQSSGQPLQSVQEQSSGQPLQSVQEQTAGQPAQTVQEEAPGQPAQSVKEQEHKHKQERGGFWTGILRLPVPVLLLIFLLSTTFAWLWKYLVDTGVITAPADTTFPRMFLFYHSPTIFINGLVMLLMFRQIRIRPGRARQIIMLFAPSAFYVYIIHTHPLIWEHILKAALAGWRNMPAALVLLPVLALAGGIYLACSCIDIGRRQVPRLLSAFRKH